jgi:hypothetical protein
MPEIDCAKLHPSVENAIACARTNLGLTPATEHPWVGTKENKLANKGQIIGFTDSTGLKRWRIDWAPDKGFHINEEDVSQKGNSKKVCHKVPHTSETMMILWWKKYTAAGLSGYDNDPVK